MLAQKIIWDQSTWNDGPYCSFQGTIIFIKNVTSRKTSKNTQTWLNHTPIRAATSSRVATSHLVNIFYCVLVLTAVSNASESLARHFTSRQTEGQKQLTNFSVPLTQWTKIFLFTSFLRNQSPRGEYKQRCHIVELYVSNLHFWFA